MTADLVPHDGRIDRAALERIIHRAAELQARQRDIGEGLTDTELMELGQEVGIPAPFLRQAILEEQTRAVVTTEPGFATWLSGPAHVAAQRTIPGEVKRVQAALNHWMTEGELLTVKRRYPDQTSWEPRHDVFASLKRSFEFGGRPYRLARTNQVAGRVTRIDAGHCHVRLLGDLSNARASNVRRGVGLAAAGVIFTGLGLIIGAYLPVALIPAALGVLAGFAVARARRSRLERVQVALEQILDRLEHGDIQPAAEVPGPRASTFVRIAEEIKKTFHP